MMNPKKIITAVLLLFAVGSLAYVAAGSLRRSNSQQPPEDQTTAAQTTEVAAPEEPRQSAPTQEPDSVIVYYFHGNMRCATCMKFEAYTGELLKTAFADELASGAIQWRVINADEEENRHFVTDFELVTKSVVLVKMQNGEMMDWNNLDKIWDLASDKTAFTDYIRENIRTCLGES